MHSDTRFCADTQFYPDAEIFDLWNSHALNKNGINQYFSIITTMTAFIKKGAGSVFNMYHRQK